MNVSIHIKYSYTMYELVKFIDSKRLRNKSLITLAQDDMPKLLEFRVSANESLCWMFLHWMFLH